MGQADAARVDLGAVRAIAREYDSAGQIVDSAQRTRLSEFEFGATSAGRDYAEHGVRVRAALDEIAMLLQGWSRATDEIAVALRSSADRYQDADARAAGRVG